MSDSDDLLFKNESVEPDDGATAVIPGKIFGAWKVLLVDDENEVHSITKIALSDFSFEEKGIDFLHAYSASQAIDMIIDHPDIALILLDVIMETEDAGLQVVKYVREKLGNHMVRIILRTGQPGQVPERKVIMDYDINDYKTKTELTAQKLLTTTVAALRAFRDIKIIESNKRGLEKIIEASSSIFELKSLENFIIGALTQISALLYLEDQSAFVTCFAVCEEDGDLIILAGTGQYEDKSHCRVAEVVPVDVQNCLREAIEIEGSRYYENRCVIYFKTKNGTNNMIFMQGTKNLSDWDRNLLDIFCGNIAVAMDNILLIDKIVQKEIEAERQQMEIGKAREALSRYVSPQIANDILLKEISLTGERTRATILFFDLRDFTPLSEQMRAENVVNLLNQIFSEIVDIIFEYSGTLDKFLGDGLMAVFGVPLGTESDELNAVMAALKIRNTLNEINIRREEEILPLLKFGIGIHTGEVIAGNVGSRKRIDYTVIGKSVNLASRVESLTKQFDTDILITRDTHDRVKEAIECRELDAVAVRGIQQPITTFSVKGLKVGDGVGPFVL